MHSIVVFCGSNTGAGAAYAAAARALARAIAGRRLLITPEHRAALMAQPRPFA